MLFDIQEEAYTGMLSTSQEKVLKKLVEIEKELPNGVSLTFAVDNFVETMEKDEGGEFISALQRLIDDEYVSKHTKKVTKNLVPFWLELTNQGREYCRRLS